MQTEYAQVLAKLKSAGWNVQLRPLHRSLPTNILKRYSWVPLELQSFLAQVEVAVSPDEKCWLLAAADYGGDSSSAFAWDEWERLSLDAAGHDDRQRARIKAFWDRHFPVAFSVKSGYAYFALRQSDLAIINGEEPEFEETVLIASSFDELLNRFVSPDSRLVRWV